MANWSLAGNWGGFAPSGNVGTLDFPALTSASCSTSPPLAACYESINDQTGMTADGLLIDDGAGYDITGNAITVGPGGVTASPSADDPTAPNDVSSTLGVPIALGAPQTWSITGGSPNQGLLALGTISGGSDPLGITLQDDGALTLQNAEVGPVTITGDGGPSDGAVDLGYFDSTGTLIPGSLDATNHHPVLVTNAGGLLSVDGTTGPLSATGGLVQVGELDHAGTLTAAGSISLDSQSSLVTFINGPGSDYSELTSNGGSVDLGGATLSLDDGEASGSNACEVLHAGDVDTLVSAPGGLSGTFGNLPDGTTVPLGCQGTDTFAPTATIHYDYAHDVVTATIATAGTPGASTTTSLSAAPSSPVTDQPVTLTATISPNDSTPAGTVEFDDDIGGSTAPIAGCEAEPVTFSGAAYTATCQTSFAASQSPTLSAVFSPADGSGAAGSEVSGVPLTVGPEPTTTTVSLTPTTVGPAQSSTMTATVTASQTGFTDLSGTITFLLDDMPVPAGSGSTGCTSVPLVAGSTGSTAQCELAFASPTGTATHTITAAYSGDANFSSSTSAPQTLTAVGKTSPPPPPPSKLCKAHVGHASVSIIKVDVVITCAGTKGQHASVSLKLSAREQAKAKAKKTTRMVVVGRKTVTLAAGQGETVHVTLDPAAVRTLVKARKLHVTLAATQKTATGTDRLSTQRLRFDAHCASTWDKLQICRANRH